MVFEELRRAVEAAERHRLPDVGQAVWCAYAAGGLTDDEAERLDGLLRARQGTASATLAEPAAPACAHARGVSRGGSRPRTPDSMVRRRRWAAAGYLPPALAASFTLGEQAVLAVIATQVSKRGQCTLANAHIAALAGVGYSTVRRALRLALTLGLLAVEQRRVARRRNDTNVTRIASGAWISWLRLRLPRSALSRSGGQLRLGTCVSKTQGTTWPRNPAPGSLKTSADSPIALPGAA